MSIPTLQPLLDFLGSKRLKFILVSALLAGILFITKVLPAEYGVHFTILDGLLACALSIWALETWDHKRSWAYLTVLPLFTTVGAALSFFGFPNLSILLSSFLIFAIFLVYNILFLVLNIFVVVEERGKSIPLYRVATTWSEVLTVVISIPVFTGLFKLDIPPAVQVAAVVFSAFALVVFYLWTLDLEVSALDVDLGAVSTFWVLMMTVSVMFLPFEALFRGLFLSSVLLFSLEYAQNSLRHTLSNKILVQYVIITLAFMFLGLLFMP